MAEFSEICSSFFKLVNNGAIEIYNEFSLQHELGFFIRSLIPKPFKVQFERNTSFFGITNGNLIKKEIDISIFSLPSSERSAIELKFPRNGQYPEQIFACCKDIFFLEQLRERGFSKSWFLIVADDPGFYSKGQKTDIYKYFRAGSPIHGRIIKPTGKQDDDVFITGTYNLQWMDVSGSMKYGLVEI